MSAKDHANFDLVYDRQEETAVVDGLGDPIIVFGHVADVNAAMSKRYGVFRVIGNFANEFNRVPGSDAWGPLPR